MRQKRTFTARTRPILIGSASLLAIGGVTACSPTTDPVACVSGESGCSTAPDWSAVPCNRPTGTRVVVAITSTATERDRRSQTAWAAALTKAALTPGGTVAVYAPRQGGRLAHVVSARAEDPARVLAPPEPPAAPNSGSEDARARRMADRAAGISQACDRAVRTAETATVTAAAKVAVQITTPSEIPLGVGAAPLGAVLDAGARSFAKTPGRAHLGVVLALPIDSPVPGRRRIPGLEGSCWVITYTPTSSPSRTLRRAQQIQRYMERQEATVVLSQFGDDLSAEDVVGLCSARAETAPPTNDPRSKES